MRRIIGYDSDRRAIWSENIPAENVGWGHTLGGQAIQEQGPMTKKESQLRYKAAKKLRGAALFDENGAWKK